MTERVIAPDGLPDDRVTCRACSCRDHRGWCVALKAQTMPDLPRRCVQFLPVPGVADRRTGEQRWPKLAEYIQEIREMDAAFYARHGR